MYSYTYDEETGGILLNSTPTVFSKEPRPVYAPELDLLGFDKYWKYDKQSDIPYMWAESVQYWYRGKTIAKLKGGNLYEAPEIIILEDENGKPVQPEVDGRELRPIDIAAMVNKNRDMLDVIENTTAKKIIAIYEKYKNKLDVFHVAFSGGKDSAVLLDLVKRALPKESFVVIFGDTGMEFPDTYTVVEKTKEVCDADGTPFYIARSHLDPHESWEIFGPPARVLRWCCSVHKSAPQTLKLREITGKDDYVGMDFVGVRKHESVARSEYKYENYGKKQKGQYSFNAILEWTSAEVWLYIFAKNLYVNEAYKKGNSRAGCLFCPMGGNKGDYVQYSSYPSEVKKYVDLIKMMDARDKDNDQALNTYVSLGGWNARKNGRDLTINKQKYKDEVKEGQIIITVKDPATDWREWIKTLGELPFDYSFEESEKGYIVTCDAALLKKYPREVKKFKQVFHKAAYCNGCRVCETNCRQGCITFDHGLEINNCVHCGQCHEIDDGCLLFHSLRTSTGGTMKDKSINSFANHAPKVEWIREFFELGNDYWDNNTLNKKNQEPKVKRFLRESGVIDKDSKCVGLFDLITSIGWESETSWGIMAINFVENPQFAWYVNNLDVGIYYDREKVRDLLMAEGVSKGDTTSIVNAFKRFCELPMGTSLNWGFVVDNGNQIASICRTKCVISDNRVVLYALYKFAEKCNDYKEFTLAWMMNDDIDRAGISPTRLFGLEYEETKSILMGLSAKYSEFINATFTNDLDKISLTDKTSRDVLRLFEEE
ncbi:phosphoadenosine phosphosulfate reductase family protein [Clostridium sp. FS41]|uniref:phosphoadenosine phosphosulfate reductase domain-containing protein n=1 Tax=Clostridium sp. FS41 TaxID=1609975 RepID=UPI0005D32CBB|nr:phosphoadenosine phosphosulfate reductase family protein [Clostridium sp. FS41]KJJ74455.1 phosphoadenosine phosphosulfate reductase [Clostridium sp. FS41]